jgi:Ca2+:H+ antiporter
MEITLINESVKRAATAQTPAAAPRFAGGALLLHSAALSQPDGSMSAPHHASIPVWTWVVPLVASGLLGLKFAHVVPADATYVLILAGVLLGGTVFAAVHHAEGLALQLGEPFGSILLAVAVTVIEAALIVSIMLSGAAGADVVARDTVFAAVMIVLNGVVGLCLVFGAGRHFEQTFQLQGAASLLAVLATLATLALILPNFAEAASGASYSILQLEGVGLMSLVLWGVFVFVQTVKHRDYFLDASHSAFDEPAREIPGAWIALISLALLIIALAAVVLLAKALSYPVDAAIAAAGLPKAFVGVVIAAIVLMPEGLAAVKSALRNRLQNSINLALGSAIASIGLTIPTVALVSLMFNQQIALGVSQTDMTLLVLTLYISALTFGTGRTTVLQGAVHLVIFAAFLLVSAVP